jgi:hypothetical protein
MRLDEIIQGWDSEDEEPKNKVHIYDPDVPGEPEPPENAADVVIMLPDNGRD